MKELWVEKWRPNTIDNYVFKDENQREQVEYWVKEKSIPHIILSGAAGTGKTTLAKALVNELGIDPYDFLEINASKENSVDTVRERLSNFVSTMPFGTFKIVLMDEADYMSANGQAAMRNLMESYHENARFILTCNYPHKIIPALHSRCQGFHIDSLDKTEFTARTATILIEEGVEFDLNVLDTYVTASYPDLRKCLNLLQANSVSGILREPNKSDKATLDYKLAVVDMFKAGKIREARLLLCSQVKAEEMDDFFRWAYNNLDLWSSTEEGKDQAILIIRNALVNQSLCADQEINLSACLVELSQIN
jgi:replication factor C small subunit